jgi:hypothetical protein
MDISNLTNSTELSSSDDYNRENEIVDLKVKHHKWKMSVLKFLTNIEIKTLYVKMLINQTNKLEMEAN